jgi:hypothetical protein
VLDFNLADTVCPYIPGADMPGPTQKIAGAALTNNCNSSAPDMLQRGADSKPSLPGG